jgi:hypothetical protein
MFLTSFSCCYVDTGPDLLVCDKWSIKRTLQKKLWSCGVLKTEDDTKRFVMFRTAFALIISLICFISAATSPEKVYPSRPNAGNEHTK